MTAISLSDRVAAQLGASVTAAISAVTATYPPATAWRTPSGTTNFIQTPDAAKFNPTTSVDLRVAVALDDWTPAAIQTLLSKWGSSGQRSWSFDVDTSGNLRLTTTANGSTAVSAVSTAAVGATDGTIKAVRAVWSAATPSVTFYTKPTLYSTAHADLASNTGWTQLGSVVTGATVAAGIFDSTAAVLLARLGTSSSNLPAVGNFAAARVVADSVLAAEWDGRFPAARYIDATRGAWDVSGSEQGWVATTAGS